MVLCDKIVAHGDIPFVEVPSMRIFLIVCNDGIDRSLKEWDEWMEEEK